MEAEKTGWGKGSIEFEKMGKRFKEPWGMCSLEARCSTV
jgi:hypothetical protein